MDEAQWDYYKPVSGRRKRKKMSTHTTMKADTVTDELLKVFNLQAIVLTMTASVSRSVRGACEKMAVAVAIAIHEERTAYYESILAMTVARLGGMVDGAPITRVNFLQRIDALIHVEQQRAALVEQVETLHNYGNGLHRDAPTGRDFADGWNEALDTVVHQLS